MSDQELKQAMMEFLETQKNNKRDTSRWYLAIFSTLSVSFLGLIFYMGITYNDVQHLNKNAIQNNSPDWTQNEFRTNASYNLVFKIPPEYQTRGGSTN